MNKAVNQKDLSLFTDCFTAVTIWSNIVRFCVHLAEAHAFFPSAASLPVRCTVPSYVGGIISLIFTGLTYGGKAYMQILQESFD